MPVKPAIFNPKGGTASDRDRDYERDRGSARERGYTGAWDKASKAFLASHPLCIGCHAVGRVEPACVTDHVEPHHGDMVKFWNRAMWQASCRWHHDVIKQQIEALYAAGKARLCDLWLNSAFAIELTRLQQPRG